MKKIFTPLMLCLVSIVFTAKAQNSSNISFTPQHNVLIEEATGDWCGWCIRGIVYLDSLQKTYPNTVDIVSVHGPYGYEPMSNNVYDYGEEHFPGMNGNFPNMVVDRTVVADPG